MSDRREKVLAVIYVSHEELRIRLAIESTRQLSDMLSFVRIETGTGGNFESIIDSPIVRCILTVGSADSRTLLLLVGSADSFIQNTYILQGRFQGIARDIILNPNNYYFGNLLVAELLDDFDTENESESGEDSDTDYTAEESDSEDLQDDEANESDASSEESDDEYYEAELDKELARDSEEDDIIYVLILFMI